MLVSRRCNFPCACSAVLRARSGSPSPPAFHRGVPLPAFSVPPRVTVLSFSERRGRGRGQRPGRPPAAAAFAELHPRLGHQAAHRAPRHQERLLCEAGQRGECWGPAGGVLGCCFPRLRGAPDATSVSLARGECRAQHPGVSSSVFQRKSWKRRYFVLDEFSISYYKCEQVSSPQPCLCPAAPGAEPWGRGCSQAHPGTGSPAGCPSPPWSPLISAGQGALAFDPAEGRVQDPRVPGQVWVMLPPEPCSCRNPALQLAAVSQPSNASCLPPPRHCAALQRVLGVGSEKYTDLSRKHSGCVAFPCFFFLGVTSRVPISHPFPSQS